MHLLFLSCLKATELIERKLHYSLAWHELLQLKVHKLMCDACKTYEKQSIFLEETIKKTLTDDKKELIDLESLKKIIHDKLEKQTY